MPAVRYLRPERRCWSHQECRRHVPTRQRSSRSTSASDGGALTWGEDVEPLVLGATVPTSLPTGLHMLFFSWSSHRSKTQVAGASLSVARIRGAGPAAPLAVRHARAGRLKAPATGRRTGGAVNTYRHLDGRASPARRSKTRGRRHPGRDRVPRADAPELGCWCQCPIAVPRCQVFWFIATETLG